jgi:class 3 adenylate cyclase/tetratricopeptide (TPR) repeat protein
MVTCPACGHASPDGFRFCGSCGRPLARDAAAGQVRKTITVVFCDLAGSTALGERLDPESLQRVMSQYFERMREVLERHQGTVEKFIGDAVVGVFGVPRLHEDDALRAVRAAVELQAALAELNKELERDWGVTLQLRTGVNTGEVVAGSAAAGSALVLGDAVNVAARLEQAAAPAEVLIGQTTWQLVRDAVTAEPVAPLALKGKTDQVAAWRLLRVAPDVPGHARRRDVPMVGREPQRRLLLDAFDRVVAERACQLVTVLGAAGVGKSRLVDEALASIGERTTVLRGRCLSYGEGITYWPVAEVIRQAAGIAHDDTLQAAQGKLAALLAGQEQAERITSRIAGLVGLTEVAGGGSHETFWAVRKLLEHVASRRPLIVALDDLHWAEPTLLDLVEYLGNFARNAPMLLVGLARTEFLEARLDWGRSVPGAATILLEPLTGAESGRLVEQLLGMAGIDEHVGAQIAALAGGNPLFIEELVAKLLDDGLLHRDRNWKLSSAQLDRVGVPTTIQVLLAARLEQLPSGERAVLEQASVVGKSFSWAAVAALATEPERTRLGSELASLVRRGLLLPDRSELAGEDAFQFRHDLIRDAAYQALPKQDRAELHERFARWLERLAGERVHEYDEIVGYHLEQATRYRGELAPVDEEVRALARRAAGSLEAAGAKAHARGDAPAAVRLLQRATSLLEDGDPGRARLLTGLGAALMEAGQLSQADHALDDAQRMASAAGDERSAAHARVQRLLLGLQVDMRRASAEAGRLLPGLLRSFERGSDEGGLCQVWRLRAAMHWMQADSAAAEDAWGQAASHARRAGDQRQLTEILGWLASAALWGPTPAPTGIRRCEQFLAEIGDDRTNEAVILYHLAGLSAMQNHVRRARELLAGGSAIFDDLGTTMTSAVTHPASFVAMLTGDAAAAETYLRRDYDSLEQMGEKGYLATTAALLAQAVAAQGQGRHDEAERFVHASRRAGAGEDFLAQVIGQGVLARIFAARGRLTEAEVLARAAVVVAERTDFFIHRGDALLELAQVLGAAGRAPEARAAVGRALDLYERKGNLLAAASARRRLERLART